MRDLCTTAHQRSCLRVYRLGQEKEPTVEKLENNGKQGLTNSTLVAIAEAFATNSGMQGNHPRALHPVFLFHAGARS